MNKKGFTLIELITVIALLAIIALVAIPAVDRALKEGREKLSNTQINQIVKGAKEFFADNIYCLPGGNASKCQIDSSSCPTFSQTATITQIGVSCLQTAGYLPANITDFNKNDDSVDRNYDASTVVKVTKNNSNYNYEVVTP